MKDAIKKLLLILWQLPQIVLGFALVKILKAEKKTDYYHFERKTKFSRFISGASLGNIILLSDNNNNEATIRHEQGHGRQSLLLGWFYLPVIGIYSAVFCNLWDRVFHKRWSVQSRYEWYYTRWCEAWADKLGRVKRF